LRPKICVSIVEDNIRRVVEVLKGVDESEVDLAEIRLDYLHNVKGLHEVRRATKLPLIATNRRKVEGGLSQLDEEERVKILMKAASEGFEYVDLELSTPMAGQLVHDLRDGGAKVIVSFHDLHRTQSLHVLERILEKEMDAGADVCKIVGTVKMVEDNLTYLNLLARNHGRCRAVCFGMGIKGRLSRVMSPLFGGEFTFASLREGSESAPGQPTIADLRQIYDLIGGST